jgi:tRNA-binding protein
MSALEMRMSDHTQSGPARTVTFDDYMRIEIRVGTIVGAEQLAGARKPAYKLLIDFGEFGTKGSSAQITNYYSATELVGKQVACVVNFPPRRIAGFSSEVLVLGAVLGAEDVVLLHPERRVPDGSRVA